MQTGWYQRYREYYAQARNNGLSHSEANQLAIKKLKSERA